MLLLLNNTVKWEYTTGQWSVTDSRNDHCLWFPIFPIYLYPVFVSSPLDISSPRRFVLCCLGFNSISRKHGKGQRGQTSWGQNVHGMNWQRGETAKHPVTKSEPGVSNVFRCGVSLHLVKPKVHTALIWQCTLPALYVLPGKTEEG